MGPLERREPATKTAKRRRRVILGRGFVALLLLLLVDTVAWAVLCGELDKSIRDAAAMAPQSGWSLEAAGTRWAGWPLQAAIELRAVSAAGRVLPGLVWKAERARVELAWSHPTTLSIRIGGAQSVQAQGLPPVPLIADRAIVAADLTGAAPVHVQVTALKATLPRGPVTLDRADLTIPPDAITGELTGMALPGVAVPIALIRLRATVHPALPVGDTPEAGARAWQQAGGHVEIAEAALTWDALHATGSGRITLDDRLQPQADGAIQAAGLPRLLDALARAGTLAPAQAAAAKAVIAILAAPAGGEMVQLPVSLEDGVLRLARFPLARFSPLSWN